MSRLLDMVEEKAAQRTITVTTYKAHGGKAVVEGRLVDCRFRDNFLLSGERRPAGDFHDMIVRLLVDITTQAIEDVEVELVKIPRQECAQTDNSLSVIKGVRIFKGFTQKIKSLLGGPQSCSHLRELVEAMGPAIIQGVYSIVTGTVSELSALMEDPRARKAFAASVINSCYVWREEGPEYQNLFGPQGDARKG